MPGLRLFTGNRLEVLAENLAEVLRPPLSSPLESEIILVQSKGMERWVSMELARYHGICANYRFPFPNRFIYDIFKEVIPDLPEFSPFEPSVMTWKIMGLLPSCLEKKGFESLRVYLGDDPSNLKRFQLSSRIADLFDQYLVFRPDMILDWDKGKGDYWQAILWRELAKGDEKKHRAVLQKGFLEALRKNSVDLKNLPIRISVFGISALPPFHMQILSALSELIDVNLFLMNPCREYWPDILSGREMKRVTDKLKKGNKIPKNLPLEKGNSLLASMGTLGRDFFKLVYDLGSDDQGTFLDPGEETLLHTIQSDILNLRERSTGTKSMIKEPDDSIRIHSCHSPMREIEVLQDRLLAMFEADRSLLPKDILVMAPEIGAYAPFIQAVFSLPGDDPRWIPFSIADRGVREEGKLIDAFLDLLDLEGSRLGSSQVMSVLESPPVRNKFGLSEADMELVRDWVQETGIRWGIDGKSRSSLGLPGFEENTWQAGMERMLLGYAMPDRDEQMFMGILPYDRIEGGEASILGNFLGFLERLFSSVEELGKPRTLETWSGFLSQIFDDFFAPDDETTRDVKLIRQTLHGLLDRVGLSGFNEEIGLDVIKSYLRSRLEAEGGGSGFLTGGLTFCSMLPMRSIPFKVICLVGMNDSDYPRQVKTLGFDLMAKDPRPGDRSRRNDDRYLFLEALLSARERLYISYIGQSIQDNSVIPPSVLVSELMDYIEQGFETPAGKILEQVVTRHGLQAFSPAYFKKDKKLLSYSSENFDAAQRASQPREAPLPFISKGLPEPGEEWRTIDLDQLTDFYANPARFFLRKRLGIYLGEEGMVLDESEPFDLSGLERYGVEQRVIGKCLERLNPGDCLPVIRALGQLPQGTPGQCLYQDLCGDAEAFALRVLPRLEGKTLEPVEVDLSLAGFRLKGRIENVYAEGLLHYRYAKPKVRDRLRLWVHHLLLNLLRGEDGSCHGTLICKESEFAYPPVDGSEKILEQMLDLYWHGLTRPIPFFPESSWAHVEALSKGKTEEKALERAQTLWYGSDFNRGEGEDPYFSLCFGKADPLNEEFKDLAGKVFDPLMNFEEKVKK